MNGDQCVVTQWTQAAAWQLCYSLLVRNVAYNIYSFKSQAVN